MILFIFEGEDDEPRLYKTLKEIFRFKFEEEILYYFCNNIFSLVDTLKSYSEKDKLDDSVDIIRVLKETANHKKTDLDKIKYSSEVSEIFLFFDYDIKQKNEKNKLTIKEQNQKLFDLFNYFEKSGSNSDKSAVKLYINYPMIESYRYFKLPLPDENYKNYTVNALEEKFKKKTNDFCDYKNLKYLCYDLNKNGELKIPEDDERNEIIKQNWIFIKDMNIKKANYICSDNYSVPQNKDSVNQNTLLKKQIEKYIAPQNKIAILNSFPLFLYEYIDENKIKQTVP